MKDKPAHQLPSFAGYLNQVFAFRTAAERLRDARQDPEFSPQSVFLAVFYAFVFRLPSFQPLEAELAQPALRSWLGLERAFRDDVLRYSLCSFDLDGLRQMLVTVNRCLKRNKAFDAGRLQGRIVAALDGIEGLSSYSRCCESCLQRRVTTLDDDGPPVERTQYYHRAVGCQIVSAPVKPFLAVEWLQPGEGEDTAARRLLAQLPELYGSPFFDILLLDSLYAQAPVPNRGLAAVTLIRGLAFALSSAFTLLHSKIVRLYQTPRIEVARQLHRSLWQMQPPARAPTVPAGAS
ncbi:MAG: hypothetical protein FJW34_15225 [Acidobacteria bacterium]|nr:hypothetical protein [Acidobacteriota bacterium]